MTSTTNTCGNTDVRVEKIIIDGNVQAQERPRFSNRNNVFRTYDPPKSREYKKLVAFQAKRQIKRPFEVPCSVRIRVYREIPKSWSEAKKQQAHEGKILPKTTPDLDNYVKSILDGLNRVAFVDDSLICSLHAYKRYGTPRAEIEIVEIKGKRP